MANVIERVAIFHRVEVLLRILGEDGASGRQDPRVDADLKIVPAERTRSVRDIPECILKPLQVFDLGQLTVEAVLEMVREWPGVSSCVRERYRLGGDSDLRCVYRRRVWHEGHAEYVSATDRVNTVGALDGTRDGSGCVVRLSC